MEMGDIYKKHVRGSRYVYDNVTIYYKYKDIKIPTNTDVSDIIEDIIEVRGDNCGRIIINEQGEIITYKRRKYDEWVPLYIRNLDRELIFDQINNNPQDIEFGSLWTGFLRKHGSKYKIAKKGYPYFVEKIQIPHGSKDFIFHITNFRSEILQKLHILKRKEGGSFWVNEYGHVWTAVSDTIFKKLLKEGVIDKEVIEEQWKGFSNLQKTLLSVYTSPTQNRYNDELTISWYPIYVGKYKGTIRIERADEPKIIYSVDDNYDRWID